MNESTSTTFNRNKSADQAYGRSASPAQPNLLLPSMSEPSNANYFKKSFESLQKNSSTDTEYSLQPYKVVKQSSNDTSSLTGSFIVDQPSVGGAMSLEQSLDNTDASGTTDLNQTVIENQGYESKKSSNGSRPTSLHDMERDSGSIGDGNLTSSSGSRSLKKQFSVDQGTKLLTVERAVPGLLAAVEEGLAPPLLTKSATPCASPLSRGFHYLRESSSTSTEEFKDDHHHHAPGQVGAGAIGGNGIDGAIDEATPSNQSDRTDEGNDGGESRYNETMC